jgi:hypothetical protein
MGSFMHHAFMHFALFDKPRSQVKGKAVPVLN